MTKDEAAPRVVTSIDELNALAVGDVLLCADKSVREVMYSMSSRGPRNILRGFDGGHEVIVSRIEALFPATVIHKR